MGVWWGRNGQIGQVATSWRQIERREVVVTRLSRSAVRREFVRIGDEGGGPSGHQMDRIHGGNISPARQFMRLRSGSVGSDTVRLGLPKKGTPADYLNKGDGNPTWGAAGRSAATRGPGAGSLGRR